MANTNPFATSWDTPFSGVSANNINPLNLGSTKTGQIKKPIVAPNRFQLQQSPVQIAAAQANPNGVQIVTLPDDNRTVQVVGETGPGNTFIPVKGFDPIANPPRGVSAPAGTPGQYSGVGTEAAPIMRTGDGIAVKTSPLESWKNNNQFLDLIKEGIQKRQGLNKDIQTGKTYWRTMYNNTAPFANKDFQLLSPSDQAAITASQMAAAGANIQGLTEEQNYRQGRMEDTLAAAKGFLSDRETAIQNEYQRQQDQLKLAAQKEALGIPTTGADYGLAAGTYNGNKVGGSRSWRNNNPANLKGDYGWGKDDKGFAVFPDENTGMAYIVNDLNAKKSGKTRTGLNGNSTLRELIDTWNSGKDGYLGGEGYVNTILQSGYKLTDKLQNIDMSVLAKHLQTAEGWKAGTTVGNTGMNSNVLSALSSTLGLDTSKLGNLSKDATNTLTEMMASIQAANLTATNKDATRQEAIASATDQIARMKASNTDPSAVYSNLVLNNGTLQADEIKALMMNAGYVYDSYSNQWQANG